jgi:hypothetical protein
MTRETRIEAIPDLHGLSPELLRVLRPIKQALEVRLGRLGDSLDKAATLRDLQSLQLESSSGSTTTTLGNGNGDATSDTGADLTPPDAITGLSANGAMTSIFLEWETNSSAYVEVWRAEDNDLGLATMVGTTAARVYADPVGGTNLTRFYWIRGVSSGGTPGPFNAASGTSGTTGFVMNDDLADLLINAEKIATGEIDWSSHISGTGKPEDNATVGATWGSDISGQPSDSTLLNSSQQWSEVLGTANMINSSTVADLIDAAAITGTQISSAAIGTAHIQDAAITNALLGTAVVGSANIQNSAITNALIANAAITSAKIGSAAVGSAAIANLAVTTAHIADAAITNAKIATAAINNAKISSLSAAKVTFGTMSGYRIAVNTLNGNRLIAGTVTAAKMVANTITAASGVIANAAITTAKIQDAAITTAKIQDAAVDTLQLAGQAVIIPVSAYTAAKSSVVENNTDLSVQSATIASSGAPISIFLNIRVIKNNGSSSASTSTSGYVTLKLKRGSTVLMSKKVCASRYDESLDVSFSMSETPGSGSHTYRITVAMNGGDSGSDASASFRSLILMETKR